MKLIVLMLAVLGSASAFTPVRSAGRTAVRMSAEPEQMSRRSVFGAMAAGFAAAVAAEPALAYDPRNIEAAKLSAPRGGGTTTPAARGMGGGLKFNPDASMVYGRLPVPVYGAANGEYLGNSYVGAVPKETDTYNNLPWMTKNNKGMDGIDAIMSFKPPQK
mmetsp:Transcript_26394/g.46251  ORF Transcript_26394/g.46251 Transcript_26394/m.46251 type:complete len:161 (+) Transcript_26394:66-548(+)|eukprot:CAMPEP_0205920844 /NCGR_PEP_ID=MMETSP1325-20131115/11840_1 /ASSEMBLY_ACC=CAM_ASM_000708 /TAXON_ID=236786 /ORGANISM="Florenciella sp., Strain RCC1007" /LENGTH=160 /DNA_ID=CAMNT_0053288577 /DNA_START=66 /DNA_END=548 /DNA_ORIENTATION=+